MSGNFFVQDSEVLAICISYIFLMDMFEIHTGYILMQNIFTGSEPCNSIRLSIYPLFVSRE